MASPTAKFNSFNSRGERLPDELAVQIMQKYRDRSYLITRQDPATGHRTHDVQSELVDTFRWVSHVSCARALRSSFDMR